MRITSLFHATSWELGHHLLITAADVALLLLIIAITWAITRAVYRNRPAGERERAIIGQLQVDFAAERRLKEIAQERAARAESLLATMRVKEKL